MMAQTTLKQGRRRPGLSAGTREGIQTIRLLLPHPVQQVCHLPAVSRLSGVPPPERSGPHLS